MTLVTKAPPRYTSTFVSPFSWEGYNPTWNRLLGISASSAAHPAANRAFYYPIVIPSPCTITRFFWLNGATASTNNNQVGIYYDASDGPGDSYLLGTSTLASGANVCQFDDVTDTPISPGLWWLAYWCNGTTTTVFRSTFGSALIGRAMPGYLESSLTGGLPSNATPAQNTTPNIAVAGFTTISSP